MHFPATAAAAAGCLLLAMAPLAARPETPKACELLNAQTAASLAGGPVAAPFDLQGIGCSYTSQSAGTSVGLTITDAEKTTAADFLHIEQTTAMQQGAKTETIPAMGEHNFLVVRISLENGLVVLYHRKMVSLGVHRKMTPVLKAQMIKVVNQMLARL